MNVNSKSSKQKKAKPVTMWCAYNLTGGGVPTVMPVTLRYTRGGAKDAFINGYVGVYRDEAKSEYRKTWDVRKVELREVA